MHVHETENEIQESLKQYQLRPIERLHRLGILSPQFMAVHSVYLNDEDITTLSKESVSVIHCPTSNLKLGSGIADIEILQKNNINVCIGTDGSASNNRQDLLHDMQLASLLAKGLTKNPATLNASTSLEMMTINAAKALGLDDRIGSIEKGKYADLTVFNMDNVSTLPIYDPMSHLVYAASREEVSHVWVNGILQYEEGHFASMDIQVCKDIALRWQLKLKRNI
jgi:5-methylthioadenosine/S-adenosylhomocysteine deaminase